MCFWKRENEISNALDTIQNKVPYNFELYFAASGDIYAEVDTGINIEVVHIGHRNDNIIALKRELIKQIGFIEEDYKEVG